MPRTRLGGLKARAQHAQFKLVLEALEEAGWRLGAAAEILGISRQALSRYCKIRPYLAEMLKDRGLRPGRPVVKKLPEPKAPPPPPEPKRPYLGMTLVKPEPITEDVAPEPEEPQWH